MTPAEVMGESDDTVLEISSLDHITGIICSEKDIVALEALSFIKYFSNFTDYSMNKINNNHSKMPQL
jgi:hypothetical protein